jgi:hypothetical protein
MMTKIEDYVVLPPPSGTDITGNIIPVADVENRTPCLRKEDYYYIRELWNAYRNDSTLYKSDFFTSYNFRSLLSDIFRYINSWREDSSINEHTHMRAGMASYSFTGSLTDNSDYFPLEVQFMDWLKSSNTIVSLDNPPVLPQSGEKLDADLIRYFYRFLSQDMLRQVRSSSVGKRAFNYTLKTKDFAYEYPKLDSSDNLYYIPRTGNVVESGDAISVAGISSSGKQVGMHSLNRYSSSTGEKEYYNSMVFPTSTVTADIVFSAPVVEAYALLFLSVDRIDAHRSHSLPLLRPMTGSGVNWSVEILKRSDYDLVTSNVTVPTLNEWVSTKAETTYFNSTVDCIFARFETPYFALPSEWNWSPS